MFKEVLGTERWRLDQALEIKGLTAEKLQADAPCWSLWSSSFRNYGQFLHPDPHNPTAVRIIRNNPEGAFFGGVFPVA